MKTLLLVRHAKATHESGYSDFERPLTEKGIHGAEKMAKHLQEKGIIPQLFVTSPALRTHQTANIFTDTLKLAPATINKGDLRRRRNHADENHKRTTQRPGFHCPCGSQSGG
jgi:phosphohistidine phosphatase